jgi:hypothetical protein
MTGLAILDTPAPDAPPLARGRFVPFVSLPTLIVVARSVILLLQSQPGGER